MPGKQLHREGNTEYYVPMNELFPHSMDRISEGEFLASLVMAVRRELNLAKDKASEF